MVSGDRQIPTASAAAVASFADERVGTRAAVQRIGSIIAGNGIGEGVIGTLQSLAAARYRLFTSAPSAPGISLQRSPTLSTPGLSKVQSAPYMQGYVNRKDLT